MWEWSRGVMVRGRVVEIGGLIDREFQTLRSTVELGSRAAGWEARHDGGGAPLAQPIKSGAKPHVDSQPVINHS